MFLNDMASGWLGSLISGLFGLGQQGTQMAFDSSQAEKNREFQSEEAVLNRIFQHDEAALQRDWSAAEAERARDWNEEMYEKYNSLSGKIAQAEQAGVNPMFAVTGQAVSPMTANSSAPSGASAGSVGTPAGSSASMAFVDIIGKVLGFKQLQAQTELMHSEAERNRAETERTGWLSKLSEREYNIITEHNFDIRTLESKIGLNIEQANEAFQLAGKYFEEAGKIATEKDFLSRTASDRVKIVEYERIMAEFEKGLPASLESLSKGEKMSLNEFVGGIIKAILFIKE